MTSAVVQCVFVRLRQGFHLYFITAAQADATAFLASFAVVLRLPILPLFAELACQDVKKAVRFSAISNPVRFSPPPPRLPPLFHYGGTSQRDSLPRQRRCRFTLANPPAIRGMACPDVKKAVRKSDGFWKSGGADGSRTHYLNVANVAL